VIGVGLIGLGVVAGEVARLLTERGADFSTVLGAKVVLKRVKVLPADLERSQAKAMPPGLLTTDDDEFFNTPGLDIIVEAIGGEQPAFDYLARALREGKPAVTSNKELVAKRGSELKALAAAGGVSLRYEASVGGGIPLISRFQYDLVANQIKGIYAIINGTTNYILTRMSREGLDFAETLRQAQELGYTEADPANDVEGYDARYKLAILGSLAFHTTLRPEDIYCEGISRISSRDFRYARELGYTIKLLAIARVTGEAIEARVHPVLIPEDQLLAKIDGVYNGILVEADQVGQVLFYGEGAGARPTASAVVADVIAAARDIVTGNGTNLSAVPSAARPVMPMAEVACRYYLRMTTLDSFGVLAQIARVLSEHRISIHSVIQKTTDAHREDAEIVIMTHAAAGEPMQRALAEVEALDVVSEVSNFIRVLE